jgi:hypothetical protein
VKKTYQIVSSAQKTAAAAIEQFAKANRQFLLPLVELVTEASMVSDTESIACQPGRRPVLL